MFLFVAQNVTLHLNKNALIKEIISEIIFYQMSLTRNGLQFSLTYRPAELLSSQSSLPL